MFDWQPTLTGPTVDLRPLVPGDWSALYAVAADPLLWAQHPMSNRHEEPVFRAFFAEALASRGAMIVIERRSGAVIGSSRYYQPDPAAPEVEIGWSFLARSHWGGTTNREVKRLLLDHAFGFVDLVSFRVGEHNLRSRRAMEKIGGTLSDRESFTTGSGGTSVRHVVYEIRKESRLYS